MLSLGQSLRLRGSAGRGIAPPYPLIASNGFSFHRGQISMFAGAPGVAKSALVQDIVSKLKDERALYLSPDTDAMTMAKRQAAKTGDVGQLEIEQRMNRGESLTEILSRTDHVRYAFDVGGVEDCFDEVKAYEAVYGDYPSIVVVDNLTNVAGGSGESEYLAARQAIRELHALGKESQAHIMVLHHVTGDLQSGDQKVPLKGIQNKVSELPSQIITLYRRGAELYWCVVKNRNGMADPSGGLQYKLYADLATMTFSEQPVGGSVSYEGRTWTA